jgi:hypothetical protein
VPPVSDAAELFLENIPRLGDSCLILETVVLETIVLERSEALPKAQRYR